jgi:hypothetical protein
VTELLNENVGHYVDLTQLPFDADVAGELRALNRRYDPKLASLWEMIVEFEDDEVWGRGPAVRLEAGIAGPRGALIWVEHERTFIPSRGVRRLRDKHDWDPYLDWSGTPCSVRGAASVPVELVFAAVREVVATRRRPTVVDMVEVDRDTFKIVGPRVEQQRHSTFHRTA